MIARLIRQFAVVLFILGILAVSPVSAGAVEPTDPVPTAPPTPPTEPAATPDPTPTITVALDEAQVPITAAAFESTDGAESGCAPAGPYPDRDVWEFAAGGAVIEELTLTFEAYGAVVHTVSVSGGQTWAITEAGWTLTAASAVLHGDAPRFTLAQTCPADGPSASQPAIVGPPATPKITASRAPRRPAARPLQVLAPQATAGAAVATAEPDLAATRADLPNAGVDIGGTLVLGTTLVIVGALLLAVRGRRHHSTLSALPPEQTHTWH